MSNENGRYQVFAVLVNNIRKFGIRDSATGEQVSGLTCFSCRATKKAGELNRETSSGMNTAAKGLA